MTTNQSHGLAVAMVQFKCRAFLSEKTQRSPGSLGGGHRWRAELPASDAEPLRVPKVSLWFLPNRGFAPDVSSNTSFKRGSASKLEPRPLSRAPDEVEEKKSGLAARLNSLETAAGCN